jgi:Tol biopolymer transport system component
MRHSTGHSITIMAVLLLVAIPVFGGSAHDLFQQALVAERSVGDLQKAIDLYGQVVKQAGSDRALAVRALLQMGAAYEKLGKAEAKKAYEQIVREFSDQTSAVAAARERLARIDRPPVTEVAVEKEGPRSKLLSAEIGDAAGEVSLDGRYFSFVSWATGDMAVRDLRSGEIRLLTDSGDWTVSNEFGGQSRFSPDGRILAYTWYDNDGIVDLRTVAVDGSSKPSILLREEDSIAYVEPGRFSPDGKRLLVGINSKSGHHELVVLELESRKLQILARHAHHLHPIEFSPDGRFALYSTAPADADQTDLFLISAAGGDPVPLAPHPSNETGVGFSPGGDRILFTSGRSGQRGFWEIEVNDGRPSGEPRLVRSDLGDIAPFGIGRDGAIYYGMRHDFQDAYIVDLDESGKAAGRKRIGDIIGQDQRPVWSADGKSLLFVSHRGAGNPSLPNEPVYVFRELDSGKERVLVSSIKPPRRPVTIAWSPDRKWLALYGTTRPDREEGLYIVDTTTGKPIRLEARDQTQPVWSLDSRTLYYTASIDDTSVIRAYDVENRATEILLRAGPDARFGTIAMAPDGKHLAFRKSEGDYTKLDIIQLFPLEGGEPRDVLREPVPRRNGNISNGAGMAFTPDGKYVLFGRWESWGNNNNDIELYRVPTSGGPSEPLGVKMNFIVGLTMNPNGRQIGFTAGGRSYGELWVLENFLPSSQDDVASR